MVITWSVFIHFSHIRCGEPWQGNITLRPAALPRNVQHTKNGKSRHKKPVRVPKPKEAAETTDCSGKLSKGCIQTNRWKTQSGTHKHIVIPHQAIFICSIYEHNITAHNTNSKRICTSLANTVLHCGLDGQKYVTSEGNERKEVQSAINVYKSEPKLLSWTIRK